MGTTFRYLAVASELNEVPEWFRAQPEAPVVVANGADFLVHFHSIGPLVLDADGVVDAASSPLVSIFPPRRRREVLWTAGEVHFLATPLRKRYPALHRISQRFSRWLQEQPLIYPGSLDDGQQWHYFLEGSIKNFDSPLYTFPAAFAALNNGQYFVSHDDDEAILQRLCRTLRLRGVECGPPSLSLNVGS